MTVAVAEVGNKALTVACAHAGNGDMDISEITGALKAYGRPSDRTTAITLLSNADEDGSGTLDYPQFKKYVIEHAGNPDDPLTALYQVLSSPRAACGTGERIDHVVLCLTGNEG